MSVPKACLSLLAITLIGAYGPSIRTASSAEPTPEAKWVDANGDCVSTCPTDKGWVCPCFVLR